MRQVHHRWTSALVTAVTTLALTACRPTAPDGPPGIVTGRYDDQVGTPPNPRKGIIVRTADGTTQRIDTTWEQRDTCQDGEPYPGCLPGEGQ